MKQCGKCKIIKDLSEFSKRASAKDNLHYMCRSCDSELHKQYALRLKPIIEQVPILETEKICSKCNQIKDKSEFYKNSSNKDTFNSSCKLCANIMTRNHREKVAKQEKIIPTSKICKGCNIELDSAKFCFDKNHPDGLSHYCRECHSMYRAQHKERIAEKNKIYNLNIDNKERQKVKISQWKLVNKDKINSQRRERLKTDIQYKLKYFISSKLGKLVRSVREGKSINGTLYYLDYTMGELIIHLESQFTNGMSWDTYGVKGWHIDHIRPISSFNITSLDCEDFKLCWALNNLQPLWWQDNIIKSNKWQPPI